MAEFIQKERTKTYKSRYKKHWAWEILCRVYFFLGCLNEGCEQKLIKIFSNDIDCEDS